MDDKLFMRAFGNREVDSFKDHICKSPVVIEPDKLCRAEVVPVNSKGMVGDYKRIPVCGGNNNLFEGVHAMAILPWVTASERLPDAELEEYQKKYPRSEIEVIAVIKGKNEATALFYNGEGFEDCCGNTYEVTHWMPLPEPPEDLE